MPRQNRVDPYGRIIAHPARGMMMGNRGCLHDDGGRIVRHSDHAAWITCLPTWPGIRRRLMAPGHYTELFFLDEATALAAGHRPCGSCRHEALQAFKRAWAVAHHLSYLPRVSEIDSALRGASVAAEQLQPQDVPDGAMLDMGSGPVLRWQGRWLAWSFDGYTPAHEVTTGRAVTMPHMRAVLRAGYRPVVHPSAMAARSPENALD